MAAVPLTINDRPLGIDMDPETPLLWALRDEANLTGTKYGCGNGDCGSCMVLIDGTALRSCLVTLGEAEGRFVQTIEGLSRGGLHPVQQALVDEGAIQCGFCTPGVVMAIVGLLARSPQPSEEQIAEAIPNICRCGTYPRIKRAILRASGQRIPRVEARPAPAEATPDTAPAPGFEIAPGEEA